MPDLTQAQKNLAAQEAAYASCRGDTRTAKQIVELVTNASDVVGRSDFSLMILYTSIGLEGRQ